MRSGHDNLELIRKVRARQTNRAPYILYVAEIDDGLEREVDSSPARMTASAVAHPSESCMRALALRGGLRSSKPCCA